MIKFDFLHILHFYKLIYPYINYLKDCAIIDTTKNFALERKPMKAEGILMHRSKNIIALRAT
jgi:hypothetical protein